MATWPTTIPAPETLEEVWQKPIESSKSINSFTSHSIENTISTKTYNIAWGMLTAVEKGYLVEFFTTNMGGNFSWAHPVSNIDYTVIFGNDTLSFKYVGKGVDDVSYYAVSVVLITQP